MTHQQYLIRLYVNLKSMAFAEVQLLPCYVKTQPEIRYILRGFHHPTERGLHQFNVRGHSLSSRLYAETLTTPEHYERDKALFMKRAKKAHVTFARRAQRILDARAQPKRED